MKLSRRNLIAGAVASAAVSPAKAAPVTVTAKGKALDAMQAAMNNVSVFEVTGNANAPHYRKGDLIFMQCEKGKASDHVYIRRKAAAPLFGTLVHTDAKAVYVRGFRSGDRMQAIPLKSITTWGRVAASFRP